MLATRDKSASPPALLAIVNEPEPSRFDGLPEAAVMELVLSVTVKLAFQVFFPSVATT